MDYSIRDYKLGTFSNKRLPKGKLSNFEKAKRGLSRSLLFCIILCATNQSFAYIEAVNATEIHPYIGMEYRYFWTNGTWSLRTFIPESYPGGSAFIGAKIIEYLGLEAGYNRTSRRHKTSLVNNGAVRADVRFTAFYLDVNGYLPVALCWELIGSIGGESFKPRIRLSGPAPANNLVITQRSNNIVWRFGLGAQYLLTDSFGARFMARLEPTDSMKPNNMKIIKTSISGALGFFFKW